MDPDTGAALYHTGVNDEATVPFFGEGGSAETYLEQRTESGDCDWYTRYRLY